ncbi:hypothetical protein GQ457_01G054780 [Hibiscus cannabinus]
MGSWLFLELRHQLYSFMDLVMWCNGLRLYKFVGPGFIPPNYCLLPYGSRRAASKAPLSKTEMQEESEKRQKRKGSGLPQKRPTMPSISQAKESLNQSSRPFLCAG